MIKNGYSKEEICQFIDDDCKENRSTDFASFMQYMLDKYAVKRKEIADITGISQDYIYKLLNGAKRTNERDYLVAIAIAIGLNINETQHILEINDLHILDTRDLRDHILFKSIEDGVSFHRINERLNKAGLPYLRVNKDMDKYTPNYSGSASLEKITRPRSLDYTPKYVEISKEIRAEQTGPAPMDYAYIGNISVKDEYNNVFYIQGHYQQGIAAFSVLDEENHNKYIEWTKSNNTENDCPYELKEFYESFNDTFNSEFFRFFLEIDRDTDKKVKDVMEEVGDTANYGERIGIQIGDTDEGNTYYIEYYDDGMPAPKQYLQVVETNQGVTYSASHESVFMNLELGDMYEAFYESGKEPQYYLNASSTDEIRTHDPRTAGLFDSIRAKMHVCISRAYPELFDVSDEEFLKEQIATISSSADYAYNTENYSESLNLINQLLNMIKEYETISGDDMTNDYVFALHKAAVLNSIIENEDEAHKLFDEVISYKSKVVKMAHSNPDLNHAINSIANVMKDRFNEVGSEKDNVKALYLAKETIDFLEGTYIDKEGGEILVTAYITYADRLDDEKQAEEMAEYYEKAYNIIRKYHMDSVPYYLAVVLSFYNNYSWLLWNRFADNQASYYLIKELELIEDYIDNGTDSDVDLLRYLDICGRRLIDIYTKEGKGRELEKLKIRLNKLGLSI